MLAERGIDESEITPESSLRGDLNLDSLELAELVVEIEEMFAIEIPDDDFEKLHTISSVVDYICQAKAA